MRLIDADVLKPTLRELLDHYSYRADDFAIGKCGGVEGSMDLIDASPTVDAAPVVRCKDCKYAQHDTIFNDIWCGGKQRTSNWYCADGERRPRNERS